MKNILLLIAILFFHQITAQNYSLNKEVQSINWTGKAAFDAYSLTGTINTQQGSVLVKGDTIVQMSIVIDMKSLDHDNKDLKGHLRGKDFFEIKKYSQAKFVLTRPSIIKNGKVSLTGNLTIKNITKEETFTAGILKKEKNTIEIAPIMNINRTSYGVEYNSPTIFQSLKKNAIADDFELNGKLIFKTIN
ncbi:YceI family protein [Croceitalea vernalis]|uniref:YceI family protein n=1 Tax=Croceitalea vernalis TaxID=3075599 RepID=A0ABU3BCP6_9FLAO|nr:YceI family protein [Croceitalea sp. P007]MDT0620054.1 YceI family protein [Croceitalea sp. P007]